LLFFIIQFAYEFRLATHAAMLRYCAML
jgi:hypothetical protein